MSCLNRPKVWKQVQRARRIIVPLGMMATALAAFFAVDAKPLALNDPLPPISAHAIDGARIDTAIAAMQKRVVIVQFVSTDQANSIQQINELSTLLSQRALKEIDPLWLLILSKMSDPSRLPKFSGSAGVLPTIIHDRDRSILAAYETMVFPYFLVTDREQRIAYTLAGPSLQFEVLAPLSIKLAHGDITQDEFDEILHPASAEQKRAHAKAESQLRLAERMIERGLAESALDLLHQAIAADPRSFRAHLALGNLLQQGEQFAESIPHYEKALEIAPRSLKANLGLASALIQSRITQEDVRPEESAPLNRAEAILESLAAMHSVDPRIPYLQGLLFERQERYQKASAAFKRAADLYRAATTADDAEGK